MTDHFGSCLCGTVSFQVKGEFDSFYLCHCRHCQKDTGSAHAANLFSHSAELVWQSGADAVASFTLPGTRHSRSFCKLCGSALPNSPVAGLVVVPAGCLDSQLTMLPTAHIFSSSKAVWDEQLAEVPKFEGLPT
ncbi:MULTISPECIES: GFA family protein [Marinobacter]|uniref:GFA family protein n=1 Tax=Marinobacter shengliensis TaxID=1389223 RepID=A0ABV4WCU2_9GAMM